MAKKIDIQIDSDDPRFVELREIVRRNGVDAWDLGMEGRLSPGDIDTAIQIYVNMYGYDGAKRMLLPLKKAGRV